MTRSPRQPHKWRRRVDRSAAGPPWGADQDHEYRRGRVCAPSASASDSRLHARTRKVGGNHVRTRVSQRGASNSRRIGDGRHARGLDEIRAVLTIGAAPQFCGRSERGGAVVRPLRGLLYSKIGHDTLDSFSEREPAVVFVGDLHATNLGAWRFQSVENSIPNPEKELVSG